MKYLLERLAAPPDSQDEFDLRVSIAAQIQRLVSACSINSRNEIDILDFDRGSIVDIGASNKTELLHYAKQLANVIARYEPRLLSPKIRIKSNGDAINSSQLVVNGSISETDENEDFYFELPLH